MRLPPKAAVLRADDPPGRPVCLGGHDLACLENGRIATKLCLVDPKRALLLCNRVLNARPHTIFLRVPRSLTQLQSRGVEAHPAGPWLAIGRKSVMRSGHGEYILSPRPYSPTRVGRRCLPREQIVAACMTPRCSAVKEITRPSRSVTISPLKTTAAYLCGT
jgi:hypothetical protein